MDDVTLQPQSAPDVPPVAESQVIEVVRCTNCHLKIPALAAQCPNCGRMRDARMDEATHRLARLAASEEIKDDIRKWVKGHAWVTVGGLLLIGLGGGQVIELLAKNRVDAAFEDRVQGVVNEEIERLNAAAESAEERFKQTRSMMDSLDMQSAALLDNRRLLASRMDLLEMPTIIPINPRSNSVRYVPEGQLTFSWEDREPVPEEGYTLELWCAGWEQPKTLSTHFARVDVTLEDHGIARSCGPLNWRVLRDDQQSQTFSCELYRSGWDRIQRTGELRVGITSRETDGFLSFDGDAMVGKEAQIVEEFCGLLSTAMGGIEVRPTFRMYEWISLLQAPDNRTADVIVSRITAKHSREGAYSLAFSSSYHASAQCLAFVEGSRSANLAGQLSSGGELDVADSDVAAFLSSLSVAAVRGSTGADAVRKLGAEPRDGANRDQILERLRNGGGATDLVHAALIDLAIASADPGMRAASDRASSGANLGSDQVVYFPLGWGDRDRPRPEWLRDEYALAVADDEARLLTHLNMALSSWEAEQR